MTQLKNLNFGLVSTFDIRISSLWKVFEMTIGSTPVRNSAEDEADLTVGVGGMLGGKN